MCVRVRSCMFGTFVSVYKRCLFMIIVHGESRVHHKFTIYFIRITRDCV